MKLITVTDPWTEKSSRALKIGKFTVKLWIVALITIAMAGTAAAAGYLYWTSSFTITGVTATVTVDFEGETQAISLPAGTGSGVLLYYNVTNGTDAEKTFKISHNLDIAKANLYICGPDTYGIESGEFTVGIGATWNGYIQIVEVGLSVGETIDPVEIELLDA